MIFKPIVQHSKGILFASVGTWIAGISSTGIDWQYFQHFQLETNSSSGELGGQRQSAKSCTLSRRSGMAGAGDPKKKVCTDVCLQVFPLVWFIVMIGSKDHLIIWDSKIKTEKVHRSTRSHQSKINCLNISSTWQNPLPSQARMKSARLGQHTIKSSPWTPGRYGKNNQTISFCQCNIGEKPSVGHDTYKYMQCLKYCNHSMDNCNISGWAGRQKNASTANSNPLIETDVWIHQFTSLSQNLHFLMKFWELFVYRLIYLFI